MGTSFETDTKERNWVRIFVEVVALIDIKINSRKDNLGIKIYSGVKILIFFNGDIISFLSWPLISVHKYIIWQKWHLVIKTV